MARNLTKTMLMLPLAFIFMSVQGTELEVKLEDGLKVSLKMPSYSFKNQPFFANITFAIRSAAAVLNLDFGDGTMQSLELSQAESAAANSSYLQIEHIYKDVGNFSVELSIATTSSSSSAIGQVNVIVGRLDVELLSSDVVPFQEGNAAPIRLKASMKPSFHKNISLVWDFQDDVNRKLVKRLNVGDKSVATHRYSRPGTYSISATAYFDDDGVFLRTPLSKYVKVVEPIVGLSINPKDQHYAVAYHGDGPALGEFEVKLRNGSHISLSLNDGKEITEPKTFNVSLQAHRIFKINKMFDEVGEFNLSVLAKNPFGTSRAFLDRSFSVQIPPRGLQMKEEYLIVPTGSSAYIRSRIADGTNVTHDWNPGAGKQRNNAGPNINVTYKKPGQYLVETVAHNMVGRESASMYVYVQDMLTDIVLHLIGNSSQSSESSVQLSAEVLPSNISVQRYIWNITGERKSFTRDPNLSRRFKKPGLYNISVVAQNHLGFVKSNNVTVKILEKIAGVSGIEIYGDTVVGKEINISVHHFGGSDVIYEWSLDDGQASVKTTVPFISRTFSREGAYNVNVYLSNELSSGATEDLIFILRKPCSKPVVRILKESQNLKVYVNDDISIESSALINCSTSSLASHQWLLQRTDSAETTNSNPLWLKQKNLNVPAFHLPIGVYNIKVLVRLVGTIVHSSAQTSLEVLPEPLSIRLNNHSNFMETVTQSDIVVIDIAVSGGHPSAYTRVDWKCSSLNTPTCFVEISPLIVFNKRRLLFPARLLQKSTRRNYFIFRFSARQPWHPGVRQASVHRIVHLADHPAKKKFVIDCKSCKNQKIRPDSKAVFEVLGETGAEFTWKLFAVNSLENHNLQGDEDDKCLVEDFRTFFYNSDPTDSSNITDDKAKESFPVQNENELHGVGDILSDVSFDENFPDIPSLPEPPFYDDFYFPSHNFDTSAYGDEVLVQDGNGEFELYAEHVAAEHSPFDDSGEEMEDVVAGNGKSGHYGGGSASNDSTIWELRSDDLRNSKPSFTTTQSDYEIKHPLTPLETPHGIIFEGDPGRRHHHDSFLRIWRRYNQSSDRTEDAISSVATPRAIMEQIFVFNKANLELEMPSGASEPKYFIVEPNVLRSGAAYLLRAYLDDVNVAEQVFRMEPDPTNGRCYVTPRSGIELQTVFTVHCEGWQSEDELTRLHYEVWAKDQQRRPPLLLYYGRNDTIHFQLVARSSSVVKVYIRNSLGTKKKACETEIEVIPRQNDTLRSIYDEVMCPNSTFSKMANDGDQVIIVRISMLAIVLQDFVNASINHVNDQVNQMMRRFIEILHDVALSNKVHAFQSLTSLQLIASTAKIKDPSFWFVVRDVLNDSVTVLVQPFPNYGSDFISDSAELSLMILERCSVMLHHRGAEHAILQSIFKILWQNYFRGEPFLKLETGRSFTLLTGYLDHCCQQQSSVLSFGNTNVTISSAKISDCLVFSAVSYNSAEFNVTTERTEMRFSASLDILHCNFNQLPASSAMLVNPLPQDVTFKTSAFSQQVSPHYALHRCRVNAHDFQVMQKPQEVSSIVIKFQYYTNRSSPELHPRHEALTITVRSLDLNEQIKQAEVGMHSVDTQIKLSLADGNYSVEVNSNHWTYATECDAKTSDLRYSLHVLFISCQMWDTNLRQWVNSGQLSIQESVFESATCAYSSIGSTAVHFQAELYNFHIKSTEDYFGLPSNHAGVVFIITLTVVHITFACLCMKLKSKHQCSLINLKDNLVSNAHFYLVTIATGTWYDAGTSSKVYIVIHGDAGVSLTNELNPESELYFYRGSQQTFLITSPHSFGNLQKIVVWISNTGDNPSWFISHVIVANINEELLYHFNAEQWLSVDKSSEITVETELTTSPPTELLNFNDLLRHNLDRLLKSRHFLLSCFWHVSCAVTPNSLLSLFASISSMAFIIACSSICFKTSQVVSSYLIIQWKSILIGAISSVAYVILHGILYNFVVKASPRQIFSNQKCGQRKELTFKDEEQENGISDLDIINCLEDIRTKGVMFQRPIDDLKHGGVPQSEDRSECSSDLQLQEVEKLSVENFKEFRSRGLTEKNVKLFDSTCENNFSSCHILDFLARNPRWSATVTSKDHHFLTFDDQLLHSWNSKLPKIRIPYSSIVWLITLTLMAVAIFVVIQHVYRLAPGSNMMWIYSCVFSLLFTLFATQPCLLAVTAIAKTIGDRKLPLMVQRVCDLPSIRKADVMSHIDQLVVDELKIRTEMPNNTERMLQQMQRTRYLKFARPPVESICLANRRKQILKNLCSSFARKLFGHIIILAILFTLIFHASNDECQRYINSSQKNYLNRSTQNINRTTFSLLRCLRWIEGEVPTMFQPFHQSISDHMYEHEAGGFLVGSVILDWTLKGKTSKSTANLSAPLKLHTKRNLLKSQMNNLRAKLSRIENYSWNLKLQYLLFHMQNNVYSLTSLTFSNGIDFKIADVEVFSIHQTARFSLSIILQIAMFVVAMLSLLTVLHIYFLSSSPRDFLTFWNMLKIFFSAVSVAYCCCLLYHNHLLLQVVTELRSTYFNNFMDFLEVALQQQMLQGFIGLLIFLCLIHSLSLFNYFRSTRKILRTMSELLPRCLKFGTISGLCLFTMRLIIALSHQDFSQDSFILSSLCQTLIGRYDVGILWKENLANFGTSVVGSACAIIIFMAYHLGIIFIIVSFLHGMKYRNMHNDDLHDACISWTNLKDFLPEMPKLKMFAKTHDESFSYSWSNLSAILMQHKVPEETDDIGIDRMIPTEFLLSELEDLVNQMCSKVDSLTGNHGSEQKNEESEMDFLRELEVIKQLAKPGLVNIVKEYDESNNWRRNAPTDDVEDYGGGESSMAQVHRQ